MPNGCWAVGKLYTYDAEVSLLGAKTRASDALVSVCRDGIQIIVVWGAVG